MILTVPYVGIDEKQQAEFDTMMPLFKLLRYIMPLKFLNIKKPTDVPYFDLWLQDPIMEGYKMNAHNLFEVYEIGA